MDLHSRQGPGHCAARDRMAFCLGGHAMSIGAGRFRRRSSCAMRFEPDFGPRSRRRNIVSSPADREAAMTSEQPSRRLEDHVGGCCSREAPSTAPASSSPRQWRL
jgi:hypothetical protein